MTVDATHDHAPARVLAADDNEVNRKILCWQLEKLGLAHDVVDSGAAAVAAMDGRPYTLVLMDVKMADMNGYEATRVIRSRARGGRVPIIAVTANADIDEQDRCLEAGMDDFLPKPIQLGALAKLLVRWGAHGGGEPGDSELLAGAALERLADLEQASGAAGIAGEIIEEFTERAAARLRRLGKALERGDDGKLERECFALRMHSRGVGALRLERVLTLLCAAPAAERAALADRAREELAAVIAELERRRTA